MESAALYIREQKHALISSWEKEVKRVIPTSKSSSSLVLRNLLPNLLEDIAQIIIDSRKNEAPLEDFCKELIAKSQDHGRHRATSSHYSAQQIIKEYNLLNRVLTEKLKKKELYGEELGIVITELLGISMSYSVGSFSNSLQEMKEKLVSILAHDIRNPISSASLALELLDGQMNRNDFRKIKDMGLKSLRRSLDLLEGLLNAVSVNAGEGMTMNFSQINMVEEVKRVWDEASEIYPNDILLECEKEEITGVFDGTAIRRIVENLLTNAVKYSTNNSPITIIVKDKEEEVILQVRNFGIPIGLEDQDKIFDFLNRREKEAYGGLKSWGIGLTFVKMAAQSHNGHVELKSNSSDGTVFSVILKKNSNPPGQIRTRLNLIR